MDIGGGFTSNSYIYIYYHIYVYTYVQVYMYMRNAYMYTEWAPNHVRVCHKICCSVCFYIDIVCTPDEDVESDVLFSCVSTGPQKCYLIQKTTQHTSPARVVYVVSERSSPAAPVTGITHIHTAVSCNSDRL